MRRSQRLNDLRKGYTAYAHKRGQEGAKNEVEEDFLVSMAKNCTFTSFELTVSLGKIKWRIISVETVRRRFYVVQKS